MTKEQVIAQATELTKEYIKWSQIKNRNCYLSQMLKGRWFLIKSYATVVGLVDADEEKYYEIGKYSSTTSKQITMLHREMFPGYDREYVEGRVR